MPVYFNENLASTGDDNVWSNEGDNLVGNPYASALSWDLIVTDKDNVGFLEGSIYFWNQSENQVGDNNVDDYLQYNLTGPSDQGVTGNIGAGQSVFVRTTSAGTLKIKPTHLVASNNSQFFRSSKANTNLELENRSWFTLHNDSGSYSSLLVGFLNGASHEYENLYDGPFDVNNTSLGLYSLVDGNKKTTIHGYHELNDYSEIIDLGFVVDKTGQYTIKMPREHINEKYYIYLEDTELNTFTNMKENEYNFNIIKAGENNTRFRLHYPQSLSIDKDTLPLNGDYHIYIEATKDLRILLRFDLNNASIKNISLYNLQGKKVAYLVQGINQENNLNVANLNFGIYIITAELYNSNYVINKKIAITN